MAGNEYAVDVNGDAILLSSQGQQVMMQWEQHYMQQCVDALRIQPSDSVLEIGFGLAYSASRIQHFLPENHTIIECDATVLHQARHFAHTQYPQRVEIIEGTWQAMLPSLGRFDCVFFDDYPLPELENASSSFSSSSSRRSRWHDFLDMVLHHVRPGARITGYLARAIELKRPGCEVVLTKMRVDVPSNCNYYPHQEALVPVITVVDPELAVASCSRELQRERLVRVREQLAVQDLMRHADTEASQERSTPDQLMSDSFPQDAGESYAGHASRAEYLASLRSRSRRNTNFTK